MVGGGVEERQVISSAREVNLTNEEGGLPAAFFVRLSRYDSDAYSIDLKIPFELVDHRIAIFNRLPDG